MKTKIWVNIFGLIEVVVGGVSFITIVRSLILGVSIKPLSVLVFILLTAVISFFLGLGILRRSLSAYHYILFFSTVIILSKILIFAKIINLSGALETTIPAYIKNIISCLYHATLIFYFIRPQVREYFGERRNTLFSIRIPFTK